MRSLRMGGTLLAAALLLTAAAVRQTDRTPEVPTLSAPALALAAPYSAPLVNLTIPTATFERSGATIPVGLALRSYVVREAHAALQAESKLPIVARAGPSRGTAAVRTFDFVMWRARHARLNTPNLGDVQLRV